MNDKVRRIARYVLARIQEGSTWRGLILVATSVGVKSNPDHVETIVLVGLGVAGLIAAILPDQWGQQ